VVGEDDDKDVYEKSDRFALRKRLRDRTQSTQPEEQSVTDDGEDQEVWQLIRGCGCCRRGYKLGQQCVCCHGQKERVWDYEWPAK